MNYGSFGESFCLSVLFDTNFLCIAVRVYVNVTFEPTIFDARCMFIACAREAPFFCVSHPSGTLLLEPPSNPEGLGMGAVMYIVPRNIHRNRRRRQQSDRCAARIPPPTGLSRNLLLGREGRRRPHPIPAKHGLGASGRSFLHCGCSFWQPKGIPVHHSWLASPLFILPSAHELMDLRRRSSPRSRGCSYLK